MSVYLTVGRHAAYDMMSGFPIALHGIADTCLLCPILTGQAKSVDVIFYSPVDRCAETARVVSLLTGCSLMKEDERLVFGNEKKQGREFYQDIIAQAQKNGWKHVHVVTHMENVDQILYDDVKCTGIPYSRWIVRQADCWDDMLKCRGYVDVFPRFRESILKLCVIDKSFPRDKAKWHFGAFDDEDYDRSLAMAYQIWNFFEQEKDGYHASFDRIIAYAKSLGC